MDRILQIDVRWLLCSAAKANDYVKELQHRAQDLNLCLLQVTCYFLFFTPALCYATRNRDSIESKPGADQIFV